EARDIRLARPGDGEMRRRLRQNHRLLLERHHEPCFDVRVARLQRLYRGQRLSLCGRKLIAERFDRLSLSRRADDDQRDALRKSRVDLESERDPSNDAAIALAQRLETDAQFLRLVGSEKGGGEQKNGENWSLHRVS